jgi:hypothetical protein
MPQEVRKKWLAAYERGVVTEAEFCTQDCCTLHLQQLSTARDGLALAVGFYNHSDTPVLCSFVLDDIYHQQAALRGLEVFRVVDESGATERYGASHVPRIGRFPAFSPERLYLTGGLIAPESMLTFPLHATLHAVRLRLAFREDYAMEYKLTPGTTYQFRYYWGDLLSPSVSWTYHGS